MKYFYIPSQGKDFSMVSQSNFDRTTLSARRFAIESMNQSMRLRVEAEGNQITIDPATSYNGNGTWVASGGASNISTDSYEYYDQVGSVRFDLSGTSGTLTNPTLQSVDLSPYSDRSNLYFDVYLPTITNLTSISIKFGSDASNYWSGTVTTDYIGDSFVTGWNRIVFDWSSKTGSPDSSAIDYLQWTITYSGSTTEDGFRFSNFFCSENVPLVLEYYTNEMVQASSGGTKTQVFASAAATTDFPLWSGEWDYVNEAFTNSVLEFIFWMTGEYDDVSVATKNVQTIVENLKTKLPSKRRYPELSMTYDQ
jgi:hypothetical protein